MVKKARAALPKAKDIEKALKYIPKWKSAIIIPQQWVEVFDINPGLIGGLTPELMEEVNAQTDAKLLQVEMAHAFYDSLVLAVGAHEEIEELRAKCIELMVDTKISEDESVMNSVLAGTKYEQHLLQWQHELAAKQGLLKDQTEYINGTTDVDISVRLQKSFNEHEKTRTRLEASLNQSAATQVIDVEAETQKEAVAVEQKTARAAFMQKIKRG